MIWPYQSHAQSSVLELITSSIDMFLINITNTVHAVPS
ncbi:hypothetical protein CSC06_4808 (plasmid) [Escherichia coli]|nr:hypothetical protein CSC06_4808 [Escherichia coli]